MKPKTDHFNYRPWLAAAVSAAFLVPLAFVGAPALAKSAASASQYQYGGSSQYQYKGKVTLCHHTHSKKHPWHQITVGAAAVKAHLKHGDTLGACPTVAPTTSSANKHGRSGDKGKGKSGTQGTTTTTTSSSGNNGKSGDHGNSGSHGKGK